jgi:3-hydroxyacyl-CoA dehydrogenase
MGTGLALIFAKAGYSVWLYSIPDPTLDRALGVIRSSLQTLADAGTLDAAAIPSIMDRIRTTTDMESIRDSELFIEAVSEKLEIKKDIFARLDALVSEDAIITSNTSYLDIFRVVPERRLANAAITHFFAPAHIVPLVEVVRGEKTSDATVDFLVEILKKAGSVPVVMQKYVPGFCVNRIQAAIGNEVYHLLDNGYISPEDLDLAVKASFIPRAMVLGLVQRYDFTGIDLSLQNLKNGTYKYPEYDAPPECLQSRADKGWLGAKSGRGFYDYSGRTLPEINKGRDEALLRVLKSVGDLIYKHV